MRTQILLSTLLAALALAACRDDASLEPAAGTVLVDIRDDGFAPETVHVAVGRSVRWINTGTLAHTISSPDFTSGTLLHDWWFEARFDAVGTYGYFCSLHTSKEGIVVIE